MISINIVLAKVGENHVHLVGDDSLGGGARLLGRRVFGYLGLGRGRRSSHRIPNCHCHVTQGDAL